MPEGSESGEVRTAPTPEAAAPESAFGEAAIIHEAWMFGDVEGVKLTSPNYRIHTTSGKSWMREFAARFAETALAHYRTSLAALPEPPRKLDVYLFARRSEWQDHTRDLMKESANLYLNLGRGGYSTRGTAVLYDIGFSDTFAILAHEGWHQYTQVTFKHTLPTWLEEGLATYMEGRERGVRRAIIFDPWANEARLEALGRALWRNRLIPLNELMNRSPQYFLEKDNAGLLTYYAQVWAMAHFLVSGEDGRYREGLARLLRDAADGRMVNTILQSADVPPGQRRRLATSAFGAGVVLAYFNRDFSEFAEQYLAFIERVVKEEGYRPDFADERLNLPAASPE